MNTQKEKADWIAWFKGYGPEKFLDSFLDSVEGAKSRCVNCGQAIYVDVLIGGGVPDWSTEDGDFGCGDSPDTCHFGNNGEAVKHGRGCAGNCCGTGSHVPQRRISR